MLSDKQIIKDELKKQSSTVTKDALCVIIFSFFIILCLNGVGWQPTPQTFFWSSSSILQAFLAFVGVLGIFIIYGLNNIKGRKKDLVEMIQLRSPFKGSEFKAIQLDFLISIVQNALHSKEPRYEKDKDRLFFDLQHLNELKKDYINLIKMMLPLYYLVALVLFSLILLPFGYDIARWNFIPPWTPVIVLIVFSIISIVRSIIFINNIVYGD